MEAYPASRFATLDLMRGIAALAVVLFHFQPSLLPHGYLAVDLFFALSGFVIAHAYGERLMQGERVIRFMWRRLVRLYPLYMLATAVGALLIVGEVLPGGRLARSFDQWLLGVGANLLFLPAQPYNAGDASWVFPAVFPAWSLMWELIANFVFALTAPRLGWRMLAAVLIGGFVLLVATGTHYRTLEAGAIWHDFWGGGGRVFWSFFAGVALNRLYKRVPPSLRIPGWTFGALLVAVLAQPQIGWGYDVVVAGVVLPLLVLLGARTNSRGDIGQWLGYASYAVYVIHVPLLIFFDRVRIALMGESVPRLLMLPLYLGVLLGVATALSRYFDEPIRAWLTRTTLRPVRQAETVIA